MEKCIFVPVFNSITNIIHNFPTILDLQVDSAAWRPREEPKEIAVCLANLHH